MAKARSVAFRFGRSYFYLIFCEISLPNDHTPIGIMGKHTHKADEWMSSYSYGFMRMDGGCSAFEIGWQLSI